MKKILNFMTGIAFVLFWLSLMSIDSPSWTPFMVCIGSWGWLMVAAWRNGWLYKEDDSDV